MTAKKPTDKQRHMAAFASVLRSLREERGLTEEQLARRASITVAHLRTMESGEHDPLLDELSDLSNALSIRPSDLVRLVVAVLEEDT